MSKFTLSVDENGRMIAIPVAEEKTMDFETRQLIRFVKNVANDHDIYLNDRQAEYAIERFKATKPGVGYCYETMKEIFEEIEGACMMCHRKSCDGFCAK